jgi:hypothetical protein
LAGKQVRGGRARSKRDREARRGGGADYYRFSIGPGHTTRYAPVPTCAAEFEGAALEFRVGDPWSKVGWWSDSAFAAPEDRLR